MDEEMLASARSEQTVVLKKFGKAETSQGNRGKLASKTTFPLKRTGWIYLAR
jgi:hypothetical protein